jgi:hypothetical protein
VASKQRLNRKKLAGIAKSALTSAGHKEHGLVLWGTHGSHARRASARTPESSWAVTQGRAASHLKLWIFDLRIKISLFCVNLRAEFYFNLQFCCTTS